MDRAELQTLFDELKSSNADSLKFFFGDPIQCDAVEYFDVRVETEMPSSEEGRLLSSHMTHISVNPHDQFISQFFLDSYVSRDPDARGNIDGIQVLNANQQNQDQFVQQIVKIAKTERQRSLDDDKPLRSMRSLIADKCLVILGDRGSGKTFFLNYLLTKCNSELSKDQIVWVRLNLVTHTGFEDSLRDWIFAQTAKILLRYYDVSSVYVKYKPQRKQDFYAALFEWVEQNPEFTAEERMLKRSKIRRMKDAFSRLGGQIKINPALCDEEICENLFRIAREKGWSFIIILDGFDKLDVDNFSYERFLKIKAQLATLWSDYENSGWCLVICSRTYTFSELTASDPFKRITPEHKFIIDPVPIHKIFEQRVVALRVLLSRTVSGGQKVFNERDWTKLLDSFASELARNTPNIFAELNGAYHHNNRSKIQLIQLLFQEFVQRKTGQGYRLLEHAMKAGLNYPPAIYNYQQAGENVTIQVKTETDYDARYIPVLTRPPLPRDENGTVPLKYRSVNRILHGIRLLQFLVAVTKRFHQRGDMDFLLIAELCDSLREFFGYDDAISQIYVREMEAFELLRVLRSDSERHDSSMLQCFSMPKAEYALRYYISDVAFLNLSAMRTQFSKSVFANGCVTLARLEDDNIENWITTKLQNSMTMFTLMSVLNREQLRYAASRVAQGNLKGRLKQIYDISLANGLFNLGQSMEDAIRSEFQHIYANYVKDRKFVEMGELDDEIRLHKQKILKCVTTF